MRMAVAALFAAMGLAGCVTPEQQLAADYQTCASYGFQPNTNAHANCMQTAAINRDQQAAYDRQASADRARWDGYGYGYGRDRDRWDRDRDRDRDRWDRDDDDDDDDDRPGRDTNAERDRERERDRAEDEARRRRFEEQIREGQRENAGDVPQRCVENPFSSGCR